MGHSGGVKLVRNPHGRWIITVKGAEIPPFLSLPFLIIGLIFLVSLGDRWHDRPDQTLPVETTLSVQNHLLTAHSKKPGYSKKWVWIDVDGERYRCAGRVESSSSVPVLYQRDDPSKCRAVALLHHPSGYELVAAWLGSFFTFFGLAGLVLTPSWHRRKQRFYRGILEGEEEG